jgi:hypothetical protein
MGKERVGEVRLIVYYCPCITSGRCIVDPWVARVRTGVVTWNPKGSSSITVNSDPVIVTILVSALLGGSGILHCTAPRPCVCVCEVRGGDMPPLSTVHPVPVRLHNSRRTLRHSFMPD